MNQSLKILGIAGAIAFLTACTGTQVRPGDRRAATMVTGSAGGANSAGANSAQERCNRPLGTLAVVENRDSSWYGVLTGRYQLTSTVPLLRLMAQQSNCFIVVERGAAMRNMQQERQLAQSGELRAGSNFGRGQMVSADYSVSPEVLFSERGTGGLGAAAGAVGGGLLGAIVGGIKTNEAAAMLTLVDNRSGVQVAVAEGSARNTDFGMGGLLAGRGGGAALGGYTRTPQGKVIAGAFFDAFNQLVRAAKNYSAQTMGDRGLGTGGRMAVDGASQPQGYQGQGVSLSRAQSILNRIGYDAGTADGQMGPKTRNAIRAFQADRGIPVNGRLDQATQAELSRQ